MYTESETVRFSGNVTTAEDEDGLYVAQIDCSLSDGPEQIKVTFDGTEYTCEKIDQSIGPCIYGGVNSYVEPDFSEYPFYIVAAVPTVILTETASTHQVEIVAITKAVNEDLANVLDGLYNKFVVTFTDDGNGNYTADKTLEECKTAYNEGKDLIGRYGDFVFQLSYCIASALSYSFQFSSITANGNAAHIRIFYYFYDSRAGEAVISYRSGDVTLSQQQQ